MPNNETKTVKWFMIPKKLIRFNEDSEAIKVDDSVINASNYEKYPINPGDVVEVGIKDGIITFMRKLKGNKTEETKPTADTSSKTKQEENNTSSKDEGWDSDKPEETTKPTDSSEGEIITDVIYAIAKSKEVLSFENPVKWIKIDPILQKLNFIDIGLVANQKVKVKMVDNVITEVLEIIKPVETEEKPVNPPKETRPQKSKNDGFRTPEDFAKETSLTCAKDIVVASINAGNVDNPEKAEELLRKFTAVCQELVS